MTTCVAPPRRLHECFSDCVRMGGDSEAGGESRGLPAGR
jgi:hypothetical protein